MKIKVTSLSFSQNQRLREEILGIFPNTHFNDAQKRFKQEELIAYLSNADGAVIGLETISREVLQALPQLKIIAKFGVGLDNVDVESAQALGKRIGWTGGVNKRSVAEQTLAFMLGLCRNLFQSHFLLKQGIWEKQGGVSFSGKTIGIVGCGHIGSELLKLLQPFGCRILICDLLDKSEMAELYQTKQVALQELLAHADVVSLHVPLTEQTYHLISEEQLRQMKASAFLLNTSRGKVVDQEALKQALQRQTIAGAALDVYEEEPPTDREFLALPNLVGTPHIAGNACEAVEAMGRSAIQHLKEFFLSSEAVNGPIEMRK